MQILLRQSDPHVNIMCVNRLISTSIYARLCVNGNTVVTDGGNILWGGRRVDLPCTVIGHSSKRKNFDLGFIGVKL